MKTIISFHLSIAEFQISDTSKFACSPNSERIFKVSVLIKAVHFLQILALFHLQSSGLPKFRSIQMLHRMYLATQPTAHIIFLFHRYSTVFL